MDWCVIPNQVVLGILQGIVKYTLLEGLRDGDTGINCLLAATGMMDREGIPWKYVWIDEGTTQGKCGHDRNSVLVRCGQFGLHVHVLGTCQLVMVGSQHGTHHTWEDQSIPALDAPDVTTIMSRVEWLEAVYEDTDLVCFLFKCKSANKGDNVNCAPKPQNPTYLNIFN